MFWWDFFTLTGNLFQMFHVFEAVTMIDGVVSVVFDAFDMLCGLWCGGFRHISGSGAVGWLQLEPSCPYIWHR